MSKTLTYRPDIDGLRAIAVLAVVLYHIGVPFLPGGYIGVDIFFVISGFLITSILRQQMGEKKFSFSTFYYRRAKRLLPAAFVTFAITSIFAVLILPVGDLKEYGGSVAAAVLSLSNIFFWLQSGYFDTAADFKPLLHTWSLSVEEQYYLVWPVTLLLLLKFGRTIVPLTVLVLAGAVSLYFAELHLSGASDQMQAGVFYLLPYRVCEFAVGGVLAWFAHHQPRQKWMLEPLFLAGLVLTIWPILTYDAATTRFPGVSAMWPCIGTALLIYAGRAPVLGKLISNAPMVYIGLLSYSLYLVHWPIVVFYKFAVFREFGWLDVAILSVASFAAAWLLYTLVETPLRRGTGFAKHLKAPILVSSLIVFAGVTVAGGWLIHRSSGLPQRIHQPETVYAADDPDRPRRGAKRRTPETRAFKRQFSYARAYELGRGNARARTVLVVGDSHAGRLDSYATYLGVRHDTKFIFIWRTGCFGLLDMQGSASLDRRGVNCRPIRRGLLQFIAENDVDEVLLTGRWTQYVQPEGEVGPETSRRYFVHQGEHVTDVTAARDYFETKLRDTVSTLLKDVDRVTIMSNVPPPSRNMQGCADVAKYLIPVSSHEARCSGLAPSEAANVTGWLDALFTDIADGNPNVTAIIPTELMCPEGAETCIAFENGFPFYTDNNHLSVEGAHFLARQVEAAGLYPYGTQEAQVRE